jgi:hypothetical protein
MPSAVDYTRDTTIVSFNRPAGKLRGGGERCLCKKGNEQCNPMKEKKKNRINTI